MLTVQYRCCSDPMQFTTGTLDFSNPELGTSNCCASSIRHEHPWPGASCHGTLWPCTSCQGNSSYFYIQIWIVLIDPDSYYLVWIGVCVCRKIRWYSGFGSYYVLFIYNKVGRFTTLISRSFDRLYLPYVPTSFTYYFYFVPK